MPSEGAAAAATVRSASASIADTSARPTWPEAPDRITRIIARSYSSGERGVQRRRKNWNSRGWNGKLKLYAWPLLFWTKRKPRMTTSRQCREQ